MSLYLPQQFQAQEHAWDLMREFPLAQLVSVGEGDEPFISWLPLQVAQAGHETEPGVLLGHLAKLNPHVELLAQQPLVTAVFNGPHAFMPTTVYGSGLTVPTWNYLAVVVRLKAHSLAGHEAKDALLKQLIGDHQPEFAQTWRAYPQDYSQRMLDAIVAYRFDVLEIKAKFKLNQHRPHSHEAMYQHHLRGGPTEQQLAHWMQRLGLIK